MSNEQEVLHWVPTHVAVPNDDRAVYFTGERGENIAGSYYRNMFWMKDERGMLIPIRSYTPSMWRYRNG